MRVRTRWFLAIPVGIALAIFPAGCPKSSSRPKGTVSPRIQSAAFTDVNVSLSVDAGDLVVVTFNADVGVVAPSPTAASVFSLPLPADTFGTSTVMAGPLSTQVTVQIAAGAGFNPVGVYPGSPGSSGIDVRSGQTGITYGTGTAVVSFGTPVDIAGSFNLGQWISLTSMMSAPRVGHSATVLESGEILIAGGLTNANSPANPAFRQALSSMEIFDPVAGTFTVTASMVRPRAFHQAIRTPGLDNIMGSLQNDDYVVMIGGWNSELTANNGPASDASVEVIVPDPDGNGDTSDLVVNPNPTWVASGIGVPTGAVVAENGPATFGGIAAGGGDAMIPPGMQHGDYDWGPELFFSGAIGITTGPGTGNNEIFGLGGFGAWVWNANLGQQDLFTIFTVDCVSLADFRPFISVDADEDGDFTDNDPVGGTFDGAYLGAVGFAGPWTAPFSFTRTFHSQTRIAGPDQVDGTLDDAYLVYGGEGIDLTGFCTAAVCFSTLGNLEYYDNATNGPILTTLNDAYSGCSTADCAATCGLSCTAPGVGATDRTAHVAVASGNAAQDVVLLGGAYTALGTANCGQAVDQITADFVTPANSTMAYGGLDPLGVRGWYMSGNSLEGTGNVLVAGGIDLTAGGSTASSLYVQTSIGGTVTPMPDMSEARDLHAAVSYPASLGFFAEDRVYIFGGWNRLANANRYLIYDNAGALQATISNTGEYFIE